MTNEELIQKAASVVHFIENKDASMGSVGCALETDQGNLYLGICIDTGSSMGYCAEHNAIGSMVTEQQYRIKTIVAVVKDEHGELYILPPCGRCREFMRQIHPDNLDTDVIIGPNKVVKLRDLLPFHDSWEKVI